MSGCLGPCVSMNNKAPNVGETEVGVSGTSQWKFCSLTPNTTPVIVLEIVNQVRGKLLNVGWPGKIVAGENIRIRDNYV